MENNNINKELERAVYKRNLEKVKALLSAGANAKHRLEEGYTLLHKSRSVDIIKELLLNGAAVNAENTYRETPLHSAVTQGHGLEVIRELLKHGARVNATNRKGNTALNHVVKKYPKDLEQVKVLLEYGADINIRNREHRLTEDCYSSLDNAVTDAPCAKLMIKYTLIRNFNKDYRKIIDLTPYKGHSNYSELSSFLEDCICEIVQMKTDKIKDSLPLYEFVTRNFNNRVLYKNLEKIDYPVRYPIYNDIILDKIKPYLKRAVLLNKLSEIQFYTKLDMTDQDLEEKKIILDYDSTYNITEYLSNDDLSNFIQAFDDLEKLTLQPLSSLNNLEEPDTRLNETSISNHTKRSRLE